MGYASTLLVNSNFTKSVFKKTFPTLTHLEPKVLYPSINLEIFKNVKEQSLEFIPDSARTVFLSLNRYERKKKVELAIKILVELKEKLEPVNWKGVHLIIAGGYDKRIIENVEYFEELVLLAERNSVGGHITFLRSVSHSTKFALFKSCDCLLYTPDEEHFGIGPLEAMLMKKMVIAKNSGGPVETVENGVTGFLCGDDASSWSEVIMENIFNKNRSSEMGEAGYQRFQHLFSFNRFTEELKTILL
jgi:alpha-1,3/alpha-1,6-mannosyltransferase